MNIVLCGYHWTGCRALELLLERGYNVFVYTHKAEKCVPDLEGLCNKLSVPYSLEKITSQNMPFEPDVICSIYYRYIIKQDVIDKANGKIFNLHPALLPKYRGCSSLTWAMINGEKECGFTFHYIDAGTDTGKIIVQKPVSIEIFDTQLTLYNRVMFTAMDSFLEAFDLVVDGYEGVEQEGEPTYYNRGCPLNGEITDDMSEDTKERFIRAMIYPPYPSASYKGQVVENIWKTKRIGELIFGGNMKGQFYGQFDPPVDKYIYETFFKHKKLMNKGFL